MKLTVKGKLTLDREKRQLLLDVIVRMNAAANWVSQKAFASNEWNKFQLQKSHYRTMRSEFGLMSHMVIRSIGKATQARRGARAPMFRRYGAVPYDARLYALKMECTKVSLATLDGRIVVPIQWREKDRLRLISSEWGEADLVVRGSDIYLAISIETPEAPRLRTVGALGVDLGIINIATDSDGAIHSGSAVLRARARHSRIRRRLQRANTRSAKRHLRKIAGRLHRFVTKTNHEISKSLVQKAKDTGRAIALENLQGIREQATATSRHRTTLGHWAFYQLRTFIEYKGLLQGVTVVLVDPRNTSRTCPVCSTCDKRNRPSRATFRCIGCGHSEHADIVGARNIATRAEVIRPTVSGVDVVVSHGAQTQTSSSSGSKL